MIDLATKQATPAVRAVEAIACRQPVLERPRFGLTELTCGRVVCVELSRRLTTMGSPTSVRDCSILVTPDRHPCIHVGKVEARSSHTNCDATGRIERKEPHAWLSTDGD